MAAAVGTAARGATSARVVADALRDSGLAATAAGEGRLAVSVEGLDATVMVTEHAAGDAGSPLRFLLPPGDDDEAICVQVVVFLDAAGAPTGSCLVVSEETLADTSPQTGTGWDVTVTPAVRETPRLPLDVCVVPTGEIGPWVRAEIADAADADGDD